MKITVTQEHIERGVQHSATFCAIATAIREKLPGIDSVSVQLGRRRIRLNKAEFVMPENAFRFGCDFDSDRPVKPFTFEI